MEKCASKFALVLLIVGSAGAFAQAAPRQCGYDRWPVKILGDKDRSRVDLKPVDTTVAKLGAIPIHEIPYPYDQRIAPEELRVYRVKARLLRVRREKDSDLHVLLADLGEPEKRMIAEIPAPECAEGTGHEDEYRAARELLSAIPLNSLVEVVGVGFFDFLHEQKGAAPNGIELHPVLSIRSRDNR
jgi:hypothetical protein